MSQKIKSKPKLNKVIFLGRKSGASKAAQFLLDQGIEIALIVASAEELHPDSLNEFAKRNNIPVFHDDEIIYKMIEANDKRIRNVDLVISYLYWRRIKMPLIKLASRGCINFHPAPLPDYKSRAGYNTAIWEEKTHFGVAVHFIDSEEFDAGPIIKVLRFPFEPDEQVITLIEKTQENLLVLFKKTIKLFKTKQQIKTTENRGGLYLTARQLEGLKVIHPRRDSLEDIHRKIRAFFFPPYHGATIEIKGEKFTLVDEQTLKFLSQKINKN